MHKETHPYRNVTLFVDIYMKIQQQKDVARNWDKWCVYFDQIDPLIILINLIFWITRSGNLWKTSVFHAIKYKYGPLPSSGEGGKKIEETYKQ